MVGRLAEMCRRRLLKVNSDKSRVMVLNGEGLKCGVHVDGIRLEHVSEFKYLACVLDETGNDETECSRKVESGGRVTGAIFIARNLQLECSRVLHETLFAPVLMYGSETMLWKENERPIIRAVIVSCACIQLWSPINDKGADMLEEVKRRATKMIPSLIRNLSLEERLKRLGMFSLICRRLKGDMTEVFKMIRGIDNVNLGKLFCIDEDE